MLKIFEISYRWGPITCRSAHKYWTCNLERKLAVTLFDYNTIPHYIVTIMLHLSGVNLTKFRKILPLELPRKKFRYCLLQVRISTSNSTQHSPAISEWYTQGLNERTKLVVNQRTKTKVAEIKCGNQKKRMKSSSCWQRVKFRRLRIQSWSSCA